MKDIILWRAAADDIQSAHSWYEGQRSGLGNQFLEAVREAARRARTHPYSYAIIKAEVRRVRLHRFPYNLLFLIDMEAIHVIACMHATATQNDGKPESEPPRLITFHIPISVHSSP